MAALDFIKNISKVIDQDTYIAGIFMDLSKAFDTMDHEIFLNKFYHCGFGGVSYDWFSKLFVRQKLTYILYNSKASSHFKVKCGVPHGSVLGPLLFVYMNDICSTSKLLSFILFADDTILFYSDENSSKFSRHRQH